MDIDASTCLDYASALLESKSVSIFTPNPEIVLRAQKDAEYRDILNLADLNLIDGFGLRIGALMQGVYVRNRVTGVDFSLQLCKLADARGWKVALIGGSEGTAEKAAEYLRARFSNASFIFHRGGRVNEQGIGTEDGEILDWLRMERPKIVLVAFGAPKQERWIHNISARITSPAIYIGTGGTLDYFAGTIPRAPLWMRKSGMEWLFRLVQEPRRVGRIFRAVILFPAVMLLRSMRRAGSS